MTTVPDLLAGAVWECGSTLPGEARPDRAAEVTTWVPAQVPGTVAAALLADGDEVALVRDLDRHDWWFRCTVPDDDGEQPGAGWRLHLDGLATVADVWLDDVHLHHGENMFLSHELHLDAVRPGQQLLVRCAALAPLLAQRRPRPRWRTVRLRDQGLRWFRTTSLGRLTGPATTPAPVGPWRPVRLLPVRRPRLRRHHLSARPTSAGGGVVELEAELLDLADVPASAVLRVGEATAPATVEVREGRVVLAGRLTLAEVELWWPHTHGAQPLVDVVVEVAGESLPAGRVGFRSVEVDRTDGGFTVVVNGVPVFCRGTSWMPPDPVGLQLDDDRLRRLVTQLRDGGHTMVRVPGSTVYEDERFLDLLDELGILLWQDCMVAYVDLPDDPELHASLRRELTQVLTGLQGRPCLAVVCGGADTEEQAQYQGAPSAHWASTASTTLVPALVEELVPGTAYLRATPGDSPLPTATGTGVTHYFGVPAYLRPLGDVRRSGVRFAAECLPLAVPPEPVPPRAEAAADLGRGTVVDPRRAVHRDSGRTAWDMLDVLDPYVRELFGVDPLALRQHDPERLEELLRATAVHLAEHTWAEWRRPGSPCAGGLTLYGRDLALGTGLGLVDALDRPKASWYALRRLARPRTVFVTDEGFDGLGVHVVNEPATALHGHVRLDLYADGRQLLETASVPVQLEPRGATTLDVSLALGGFRDLTWAYRFGPPAADVVALTLVEEGPGEAPVEVAQAVWLPAGIARARERDLGLTATLTGSEDRPVVEVRAERFAQGVRVEASGWVPEDAWFPVLPGAVHRVALRPAGATSPGRPQGRVAALNATATSPIRAPR